MLNSLRTIFAKLRYSKRMRDEWKEEIERIKARIQLRSDKARELSRGASYEVSTALIRELAKANASDRLCLNAAAQMELRRKLDDADIEIPDIYFDSESASMANLTREGEMWARAALRKHRRENIEFWAKIVMPSLSLLLSIIALVVAAHKK